MVRHVIWDWNGTLVDDVSLCVQILNQELKAHQIEEISINEYRQKFFFPVACYYKKLGLPFSGFKYEALANRYISEYRKRFKECQLHDGAFKTLEWLNSQKFLNLFCQLANNLISSLLLNTLLWIHFFALLMEQKILKREVRMKGLMNTYQKWVLILRMYS